MVLFTYQTNQADILNSVADDGVVRIYIMLMPFIGLKIERI